MNFTSKQKEIVARKLGYDGPMQGFDEFINSSPALQAKYNAVTQKYVERMAKGGSVVKKYQAGGDVTDLGTWSIQSATPREIRSGLFGVNKRTVFDYVLVNSATGETKTINGADSGAGNAEVQKLNADIAQKTAEAQAKAQEQAIRDTGGVLAGEPTTISDDGGKPVAPTSPEMVATKIQQTPEQDIGTTSLAPATATTATPAQAAAAQTAAQPSPITAATTTAAAATPALQKALEGVGAVQGEVSPQAQVSAATMEPTATAVGDVEAAQLAAAQQVQGGPERQIEAGELINSAVDQSKYEQVVNQTKDAAAQGEVTVDMTVQGQLAKLTADFDAANPPGWAAGALRAATATMAARGIGASSMAGQALIQAAIESALPIATADAQAYQAMAAQNLSNRQQTAVLAAQQRAAFLGQEFDQEFQTRVTNAAKVSDIANMNFSAQQQIALENARLAQSVDLANLSNRQAVVMAEAAQIATLETQNLSNYQQAAVVNAQSFLQMDLANLSNEQQTELFKAQQISQSLLTDTAAENAARQFNASSTNQTNQFMTNLATQVSQFNAAQQNAINQFNTDQANAVAKFNAEAQNARTEFNSKNRLIIDQSNAQWRREISTADTAAANAANYLNAQNMQQMTLTEYNNEVQLYRDQLDIVFNAYEKDADRINAVVLQEIATRGGLQQAELTADSNAWGNLFSLGVSFLGTNAGGRLLDKVLPF